MNDYNFEMFDIDGTEVRRREAKEKLKENPIKSVEKISFSKRGSVLRIFLCCAVSAGVLIAVLMGHAKNSEIVVKVSAEKELLEEAKRENERLHNALDVIATADKVESYATEVLGMTKIQPEQKIYLKLNIEKLTEVIHKKTTVFERIGNSVLKSSEFLGF
jgi:cell division protein FtsL